MRDEADFQHLGTNYTVPMVMKLLKVFKAFRLAGPRLALTQVISLCDIPKASAFRILETLRSEGYLIKDLHGSYRMTYQLLQVAMVVQDRNPLRKTLLPYLEQLNREFRETVNLGALEDNDVVYVEVLGSSHGLRTIPSVGSRAPLHATALGKAAAASLPSEELTSILGRDRLERFTPNTITSVTALLRELVRTRERGYGIDNEEATRWCVCVAAPIFGSKARVTGAISVSAPTSRMPPCRIHQLGTRLTEVSRIGSELLGSYGFGGWRDRHHPSSTGSEFVLQEISGATKPPASVV
jgi:DNA-binding IclR family transcriptional regulator